MGMCYCTMEGCASLKSVAGSLTKVCNCLTDNNSYLSQGYCPFFKTEAQADRDRLAAEKRVRKIGLYKGENYTGPIFTRPNKDGIEEPDIYDWMRSLVSRGIISDDYYIEFCKKRGPDVVV